MLKLILILFIESFAFQQKWITYTESINKFTIRYPEEWTQTNNNRLAFLSPKENDKDQFQENVNIILQDLSKQPMTLDQYTEISKKQIVDNLGSNAIVSLKSLTMAGQQAKEFVYDMNYQGKNLKVKQYWFIKNNTAFLFSYTAESPKFDKYQAIADNIIKSFKFF